MLARYMLGRLAAAVPVVLGVTLVTFLLMHATAGGYVPGLDLNPSLTPEDVARLKQYMGLDRPLHEQYLSWIWGLLHGDLGRSLVDGSPIMNLVLARIPATLELTVTAALLGTLIAVPLGIAGAVRRGGRMDHLLTAVATAGFSVPQFWLGLMLILLFSISFSAWGLPFLPQSGAATAGSAHLDPLDLLVHLVMPAAVLSFFYLSVWSRFTRSSMIEALSQDYVRTARAKGMREWRVTHVHALRNAVIPLVTLMGLELPALFGGGLIVEVVFGWPGIGKLALEKAQANDYTAVLGITTFVALLVVVGNLVADLLYAVLDPRIRYSS